VNSLRQPVSRPFTNGGSPSGWVDVGPGQQLVLDAGTKTFGNRLLLEQPLPLSA
jgi:hypothetical protein